MADRPIVSVVRCDARESDEVVADRLAQAAAELGDLGRLFAGKRKVFIKSNLGIADVRLLEGRQSALTDQSVVRATVALIRQHYSGELLIGDATTDGPCARVYQMIGLDRALADYDVRQIEPNEPPYVEMSVPGDPIMFSSYFFNHDVATADAIVSIAKMKSHVSTGATLCLKNLFGLPPISIYGRPRRYLHAPVRLPRVIADEGQIFRPVLNVIDGLVAQDEREWHGPPVKMDTLIVGDNVLATDATAMRLMGMDPMLSYPEFPFHFDANPLRLAAEAGVGPIRAEEIDVRGADFDGLKRQFRVDRERSEEVDLVRRSVAKQAAVYLDRRDDFLARIPGKIVALANDEVLATVDSVNELPRRADLAGRLHGSTATGIFVKRVDPPDADGERMDVYGDMLIGQA